MHTSGRKNTQDSKSLDVQQLRAAGLFLIMQTVLLSSANDFIQSIVNMGVKKKKKNNNRGSTTHTHTHTAHAGTVAWV